MASLVSAGEAAEFKRLFGDIFDTFKRSIVIHKEPLRVVGSVADRPMAGYGTDSQEDNVTFVPQNQTFDAVISYNTKQDEIASEVGTYDKGEVRIKVQKDAADYIKNGKTEKIEFDGKAFNTITSDAVQNFLGTIFYIFYLKQTS
jgi:Zn/Cd-binding protein ZinT